MKNIRKTGNAPLSGIWPKTNLKMKLTTLFLLVSLVTLNANTYSQSTRISLHLEDVTVAELFTEIESSTDFRFLYNHLKIDAKRKISIDAEKESISSILNRIFSNTDTYFKVRKKLIVVKRKSPQRPKNNTVTRNRSNQPKVQISVQGTVTDTNNAPLIGANIIEVGTTNGTQTDFDGNFSITVSDENATLSISYVGFVTQKVDINGKTSLTVTLEEDASQLSEVVVMGYASQTRGDVTGSVASVNTSEALKTPVVNAGEALEGRVAGVTLVNNNTPGGTPKINVRGYGTNNNTDPLFIIDGVQTDDASILNNINPADIEQMNVLRDGAAAIYGARAANGVVIVTTKSGGYNMSSPVFSLDMYTGFSQVFNKPGVLNAQQHGEMLWESFENDGIVPSHPQYGSGPSPVVPSSLIGYQRIVSYDPVELSPVGALSASIPQGGTDWIDVITRSALTSNISFSVSNGNETGKYFLSAGYLKRDGIIKHTGFERLSTRLNSEFRIGDRFRIGENLNVAYTNSVTGPVDIVELALTVNPLIPVYDDAGNFAGTSAPGLAVGNPLAFAYRARNNYDKRYSVFGDIHLAYDLLESLTFKSTLSGGFNTLDSRVFSSVDPENSAGAPITVNQLSETDFTNFNWAFTNTLNYDVTLGENRINALIGIESLKESSKGKEVSRTGYLFETPDYYLLNNGTGAATVGAASDGYSTLYSLFGTVNYSFKSKYFATATVRRDESSRFLGDNKSAIFPSFSAGWLLSDEAFFNNTGFFNRLKLKGSWGQLGNQTLPANNPTVNISNLDEQFGYYSLNGSTISTGAILSQVGNPNLKWETSVTTNFGVELAMLDSRLTMELEGYQIKTKDLITRDFSLISSTAIDAQAPLVNFGDMKNTGFDLSIGFHDSSDSGFTYGIDMNVSHYKNEVVNLSTPVGGSGAGLRGQIPTRTSVGEPLSYFFGRRIVGFTDEGRYRYEDVNGDGEINDDDRTKIGSPHPDFTYSFNLNGEFKGFDASLFFTGSSGNEIYNFNKFLTDFPAFINNNRSIRVLDSWTPTNTDASLPALSASIQNNEADPNSYFVENGSFFKLKNVQVGYTLPTMVSDELGLASMRIYLQATNLFIITDYSGFDPEIISYDNFSLGIDSRIYPSPRVFTLGVNVKF
ncbi:TonB-dependent receptor [Flagellimonas marinaquae]|nr:TonB-dependent receptor [Allomuricauda aquimarina]